MRHVQYLPHPVKARRKAFAISPGSESVVALPPIYGSPICILGSSETLLRLV